MEQDYSIGIEQIDLQHKELSERMELLRDAMRKGQSRDTIRATLRFLEGYAVEHSATEERYMLRYNYPGILLHKTEHATFLGDLGAPRDKFLSLEALGEFTTFPGLDIVRRVSRLVHQPHLRGRPEDGRVPGRANVKVLRNGPAVRRSIIPGSHSGRRT